MVDLANVLSVRTFLGLTRGEQDVILTEVLPEPERLCVRGGQGRFHHELIVPASVESRRSTVKKNGPRGSGDATVALGSERQLPGNSDWFYIKIYERPNLIDTILVKAISPMVNALYHAGVSNEWFFIRYTDPYHHLRVRFRLTHCSKASAVFAIAGEHLSSVIEQGLIWKWQVDTYDREFDKYGGEMGLRIAERLFCADSLLALRHIEACLTLRAREESWVAMALLSIDKLLQDFGYDIKGRYELLTGLTDSFKRDETSNKLEIVLSNEFRKARNAITSAMVRVNAEAAELLGERSLAVRSCTRTLTQLWESGKLSRPVASILRQFIHMNANRLMRTPVKQEEIKLYAFLQRLYRSCVARGAADLIASKCADSPYQSVAGPEVVRESP